MVATQDFGICRISGLDKEIIQMLFICTSYDVILYYYTDQTDVVVMFFLLRF